MQRVHPGHKLAAKQRTSDVLTDEQVDFSSLLLAPSLLRGLSDSGFDKPSPIQLKAIPLGRCGLDLIAQAKSGTGKTCVFSVIALENIVTESTTTQVLILAPTREIAVQIKDVVRAIGCHMDGLNCQVFIGGLPLDDDKKALKGCHIAVGSPGRIKSLIENKHLITDSIRMFILDEADKLLDENFQEQINWIFSTLPANKQMMAFSATYPEYLANHLTRYMREPTFVRLSAADQALQGIKQFYSVVPFHHLPHKVFQEKVDQLLKLLSRVNFHQCLLFSNYQIRAQSLSSTLCAKGWPATFIAGGQTQQKRLKAMEKLKEFKCRILISTDLTARGIDAENVNLVVNMDIPRDSETYLHRIGRAGRFGTKGVAVTFVAKGKEEKLFGEMQNSIGVTMETLPDHIPASLMNSDSLLGGSQGPAQHCTVEVLHQPTSKVPSEDDSSSTHHTNKIGTRGNKCAAAHPSSPTSDEHALVERKQTRNGSNNGDIVACEQDVFKEESLENAHMIERKTVKKREARVTQYLHDSRRNESLNTCSRKEDEVQQERVVLPSVDEFQKDFEEYLAMASTFENIELQNDGNSTVARQLGEGSTGRKQTKYNSDINERNGDGTDNDDSHGDEDGGIDNDGSNDIHSCGDGDATDNNDGHGDEDGGIDNDGSNDIHSCGDGDATDNNDGHGDEDGGIDNDGSNDIHSCGDNNTDDDGDNDSDNDDDSDDDDSDDSDSDDDDYPTCKDENDINHNSSYINKQNETENGLYYNRVVSSTEDIQLRSTKDENSEFVDGELTGGDDDNDDDNNANDDDDDDADCDSADDADDADNDANDDDDDGGGSEKREAIDDMRYVHLSHRDFHQKPQQYLQNGSYFHQHHNKTPSSPQQVGPKAPMPPCPRVNPNHIRHNDRVNHLATGRSYHSHGTHMYPRYPPPAYSYHSLHWAAGSERDVHWKTCWYNAYHTITNAITRHTANNTRP